MKRIAGIFLDMMQAAEKTYMDFEGAYGFEPQFSELTKASLHKYATTYT